MEKEMLEEIKKTLLKEKEKLENDLQSIAKKKGKKFDPIYPNYGSKDEENAAELEEYSIHLALDKNLEKLLTNTIKALAKIEAGTYGKCDLCGIDINEKRLKVFPSANLCIKCQRKKDNPITKFFSRLRPSKKQKK